MSTNWKSKNAWGIPSLKIDFSQNDQVKRGILTCMKFVQFNLSCFDRVIVKQETKRNETQQKRNERKKLIKRNETIFFYMRQQSTKCQWRIEKPLKFTGRFGYGRKK